jgi:hypothetical protein
MYFGHSVSILKIEYSENRMLLPRDHSVETNITRKSSIDSLSLSAFCCYIIRAYQFLKSLLLETITIT